MADSVYDKFSRGEMTLRDYLAADRTILANERTLLAYVRTALTFLITGLGLLKLFEGPFAHTLAWVSIFLFVALLGWGFQRFCRFRTAYKKLTAAECKG